MNTIRHLLFTAFIVAVAQSGNAASGDFKPEFTASLASPYLKVQAALAADDLPAAKSAAGELLAIAAKGPEFKTFTESTEAIMSAANIGAARTSFLRVSDELIALIDRVGTTGGPALFVAHCPMAFSGKGGDWLQADKEINNPYYGASMLKCGTIKRQVTSKSASPDGHGGPH
jgi:Cu(I)/Ag(I) efflux system membrane fusion protein